MSSSSLNRTERNAALSLASIFSMRMFGPFMIYPIFVLYTDKLVGATEFTIGLALGIYGLTQALFQLPFGLWSDRVGRRNIIALGIILFALGSVIAALSTDIWGIIIGRTVQGMGAVGGVVLALMADLTREQVRTRAMAIIGMTIGVSFAFAVVLGPVLDSWIGLSGIFWFTAATAIIGLIVLFVFVPEPDKQQVHRDTEPVPALLSHVLKNTQLLRLDLGIFIQHAILTITFLGVPILLKHKLPEIEQASWLYLIALVVSVFCMVPFIIYGEKKAKLKQMFVLAVVTIGLMQLIFFAGLANVWLFAFALILFFTAFNLLEAILPSLVSRVAPAGMKGTAMGVYSSSQFLGIFAGGVLGGVVLQHFQVAGIFMLAAVLSAIWLLLTLGIKNPGYVATQVIAIEQLLTQETSELTDRIKQIPGVLEVVIANEDKTAILKVDTQVYDSMLAADMLGLSD